MIRKINSAYNPDELSFLRMKGYTVIGIANEIKQLINDLAETTMNTPNCAGLTANQVWDDPIMPPPAVFVIRMENGVIPFINPVVDKMFKRETDGIEMCMSVPRKKVRVLRPYHIATRYMDGDGNSKEEHFYATMSRIFMHEYDHIQGKLILDHE